MPPKKYVKQLTALPESAEVRCSFTFALIGLKAHTIASHVMEADLHFDTIDMMGGQPKPASDTVQAPSSTTASVESSDRESEVRRSIELKADEKGTWCLVDDSSMCIARIRFSYSEGFSESLPSGTITDANSVRNTCFIFLADPRLDSTEVVSSLNSGFAEMSFMYRQVHAVGKLPTLRAVLLRHESEHATLKRYDSDDRLIDGTGEDPLKPFASRLRDVSDAKAIKQVIVSADFDNSDALYECFADLAKDLYDVNSGKSGGTGRANMWKSVRNPEGDNLQQKNPKARTCNVL